MSRLCRNRTKVAYCVCLCDHLFVSPPFSMPTPIPPSLSSVLQPPAPGSLTLVTSVLDATSNWLLLRYIYAALRPEKQDGPGTKAARVAVGADEDTTEEKNQDLKVIFISFLRPFELWREIGKKIVHTSLPFPPFSSTLSFVSFDHFHCNC